MPDASFGPTYFRIFIIIYRYIIFLFILCQQARVSASKNGLGLALGQCSYTVTGDWWVN